MKRKIIASVLVACMLLCFAACGESAKQDMQNGLQDMENGIEDMKQDMQNMNPGEGSETASKTRFSEHDLEFDIPENWQRTFLAQRSEHNSSTADGYTTVDFFHTTPGGNPIRVMSIAKFSRESWDKLSAQDSGAKDKKLGESKDGKWVYSLNFEENTAQDDTAYTAILKEARNLRDRIKITA